MVETVDSQKLALKLHKELLKIERAEPLKVLVQVLTGDEDSKHGVIPAEVPALVQFIQKECPTLAFSGLMSMGLLNDIEGFKKMKQMRTELAEKTGVAEEDFVLSMGTSMDFESAIKEGSTQVRLGSTIFGARNYPKKE